MPFGVFYQQLRVWEILQFSISWRVQHHWEFLVRSIDVTELDFILEDKGNQQNVNDARSDRTIQRLQGWMSNLHPAITTVHVLVADLQFESTVLHQILYALQEIVIIWHTGKREMKHDKYFKQSFRLAVSTQMGIMGNYVNKSIKVIQSSALF